MFSSIAIQLPDQCQLRMSEMQEFELTFKWKRIQDDVMGREDNLKNVLNLPGGAMKTVRFIIFHLLEKDTNGE